MIITIEIPNAVRQVIPILFGALITVSFGMMLGWASVSYPYLLRDDISPIYITLGQTALIAGFLWEGNTVGVLFSTSKYIPCKLAVSLCCALQIVGWILMFYSQNIYWFLASRASVGFAHGYGLGQLKRYIKDTCEPELAAKINQYLPSGMALGVFLNYVLGSICDFRSSAFYAAFLPGFALISFSVFPKYVKEEDTNRINNVLSVKTSKDELTKNLTPLASPEKPFSVFEVIKDRESRNNLLLVFLIVFMLQYGGGAANIVFSQIIFTSTKNPYPKVCACLYGLAFFINMVLSLKYAKTIKRKTNLLVSVGACILLLSLTGCYFYLRNSLLEIFSLFSWAPLFLLIAFNFFHTFGMAAVPLLILGQNLPKRAANIGSKFWTIHFSMSAVISTKIFQVLYGSFGMTIGYVFFVCVLLVGFIIILFVDDFTPEDSNVLPIMQRVHAMQNHQVNQINQVNQVNQVNQANQVSQVNQVNQTNQTNQTNEVNRVNQSNQVQQVNEANTNLNRTNGQDGVILRVGHGSQTGHVNAAYEITEEARS